MSASSPPQDLDRVSPFETWCKRVSLSVPTGRRLVAMGRGPRITRLSERRIGVRERDHLEWLEARSSDATAA
jgi:hypothetical protein